MKRLISLPIILTFFVVSTHSIVDHHVNGHHAFSLFQHAPLAHAQDGRQSPRVPPAHHHDHDDRVQLVGAPHSDVHTHFVLPPSAHGSARRSPHVVALQGIVLAADDTATQASPLNARDLQASPHPHRPYLRCCTFLI